MPRIITILTVLVIVCLILIGLSKQIMTSLQAGERLDQQVSQFNELQDENRKLKENLAKAQSPEFTESVARDKLNLSHANETVVVIPQDAIQKVLSAQKVEIPVKIPNWQGWVKLFFH